LQAGRVLGAQWLSAGRAWLPQSLRRQAPPQQQQQQQQQLPLPLPLLHP
jgi:hypothetical protein